MPEVTQYFVYVMTNRPHGTLYVGVTGDLVRRVHQHRTDMIDGFSRRYRLHRLVYFEATDDVRAAIQREKNIKHWVRAWKVQLIEGANPTWRDLWPDITG